VPSANTLVWWVNENAFASIVQARPCPTFGRPVRLRGSPHRLRPGTSPHALRIPPHDGHPALRSAAQEGGSRSALAVSGFRLRARVGFFIPSFFLRPARHYPRFWIWHPSSGRQRDFNPPEQRAAQRTLRPLLTSRSGSAPSPFQACGEISPGKSALLHCTTAGSTPLRLDHESFAVFGPLALLSSAFYPVLVHRLAVFAPRFLPTLGHPHAVALRFVRCDQLTAGLAPARVRPCWAHQKNTAVFGTAAR
jgi:hypothetical protein